MQKMLKAEINCKNGISWNILKATFILISWESLQGFTIPLLTGVISNLEGLILSSTTDLVGICLQASESCAHD